MNQDNLEYLKKNLLYTGFGEKLNPELEKNISSGKPEFKLNHKEEFNNRQIEATLHFKKGDKNEMYFFNGYDAKMTRADGKEESQYIFMNQGRGFTLKEAFNLLDGRAVFKEFPGQDGKSYHAWKELDFEKKNENGNYALRAYHDNYGYNLEKALKSHPFKELSDSELKERLVSSLQKGNLQAVTTENGERLFIAANPSSGKSNSINMFDKTGKEVSVELRNTDQKKSEGKNTTTNLTNSNGESENKSEDLKKNNGKAVPNETGKKDTSLLKGEVVDSVNKNKSKDKAVKDLMPQKEQTSKGKGLSM